jgi:hypothetical protein
VHLPSHFFSCRRVLVDVSDLHTHTRTHMHTHAHPLRVLLWVRFTMATVSTSVGFDVFLQGANVEYMRFWP